MAENLQRRGWDSRLRAEADRPGRDCFFIALASDSVTVYRLCVRFDERRLRPAACGPECRHARSLPVSFGEWVWCVRCGEPRATGENALECLAFAPRPAIDGLAMYGGRRFGQMRAAPANADDATEPGEASEPTAQRAPS